MAHVGSVPSRHVLSGVPSTNRRLCLLFQVQPRVSPLPGAGAGALGQHRVRLRHVSTLCRARAAPRDRHISQPSHLVALEALLMFPLVLILHL